MRVRLKLSAEKLAELMPRRQLTPAEMRLWLDRAPVRDVCLVHGTETCAHDEPKGAPFDEQLPPSVHEPGCVCSSCNGGTL